MDFITWWFDKHYIWSTILTPGMTLGWCMFKGDLFWRFIVALIMYVLSNSKYSR